MLYDEYHLSRLHTKQRPDIALHSTLSLSKGSSAGFTLLEVLLVIAIIVALTGVVLRGVNIQKTFTNAMDAEHVHYQKQIENAMYQHLVQKWELLNDTQLPVGKANAKPICRYQVTTDATCVNLDGLIPEYLAALPVERREKNPNYTGYTVYKDGGRVSVIAAHLGEEVGTTGPAPTVSDVQVAWGISNQSIIGVTTYLPWFSIADIHVVFSEDVTVQSNAFSLQGAASYAVTGFSYDANTHDAHWTVSPAIDINHLTLSLDGSIHDADGLTLPGGGYIFNFSVLPGDVNNDHGVNTTDCTIIRNNYFPVQQPYDVHLDMNGDGIVNVTDWNAPFCRGRIGTSLP